jgi:hypothetical protein
MVIRERSVDKKDERSEDGNPNQEGTMVTRERSGDEKDDRSEDGNPNQEGTEYKTGGVGAQTTRCL